MHGTVDKDLASVMALSQLCWKAWKGLSHVDSSSKCRIHMPASEKHRSCQVTLYESDP